MVARYPPPFFQPPINTDPAADTCLKDIHQHIDLSATFDRAGYYLPRRWLHVSQGDDEPTRPKIAGVPISSYDVEVTGSAYFKTLGLDLLALDFTCLYSPMLELEAVGWRRDTPGASCVVEIRTTSC